jgi:hypothetical protein
MQNFVFGTQSTWRKIEISLSNISISDAVSKEVAGDDGGLPNRMINLNYPKNFVSCFLIQRCNVCLTDLENGTDMLSGNGGK